MTYEFGPITVWTGVIKNKNQIIDNAIVTNNFRSMCAHTHLIWKELHNIVTTFEVEIIIWEMF